MRSHHKFWPRRLPHSITVPSTSLWDNLAISAQRFPDKDALVFLLMVGFLVARPQGLFGESRGDRG